MFQPAPGAETTADDIIVSGEALKKVSTISYLGSVISDDCIVNNDIATRLEKANKSYGALQKRLWSQRGIKVKLKSKYTRQPFLHLFYMGHNHECFTGETLKNLKNSIFIVCAISCEFTGVKSVK